LIGRIKNKISAKIAKIYGSFIWRYLENFHSIVTQNAISTHADIAFWFFSFTCHARAGITK
jgi:hypothetical protein